MRRCANCGKSLRDKRSDATACSNACRQALHRQRSHTAPVAELVAMWNELRAEYGDDMTVARVKRIASARPKRIRRDRGAEARREKCNDCDRRHSTATDRDANQRRFANHEYRFADGWRYLEAESDDRGRYWITLCPDCGRDYA